MKVVGYFFAAIALIVFIAAFSFGLRAIGLIGGTVVEREVFEQSFQFSEARKTAIANYEAQLSEINSLLADPDLSATEKRQLNAQAARLRVLIQTEKDRK